MTSPTTARWVWDSKALTLSDWDADKVPLLEAGWEYESNSNGVVYIKRRFMQYLSHSPE